MFINSDLDITITKVFSAIRLLNSPVGTIVTNRNRERWAVVLKVSGKTIYNVDGEQIVSDKNHPVILPRGCSYSWKCVESGECVLIEFEAIEECKGILSCKTQDPSYILKGFNKIEEALNSGRQTEAIYTLYGIILHLQKSEKKEYTPKHKKEMLRPATEYITQNYYDGSITNDYLAELCGLSTVYFRKMFEKVYGVPPIKYLNNFRIEKAKAMLFSDYESIQQIAQSVGYNSIYHFSKMFKIHTGKSPKEYEKTRTM